MGKDGLKGIFFKFWTIQWPPAAIINRHVRNITFDHRYLAISDRYATFFLLKFLDMNGNAGWPWVGLGRQCQLSNSSEIFG